jgi:hypothetical protein
LTHVTREDLSHVTIPEESSTIPSAEAREKRSSTDDVEVVRRVISPPEQKLPAIRIHHPSPELREGGFAKEIINGIEKPLVNGWRGDYFGEDTRVD